ncbi:hypothetical protein SAMN05192529_101235 [Arachidicoccus rhizosphaerae]|uniref:Uncharacterized protein n=1 Tax=Arachidicoccus rhizosphaerae TaxID=551991 RepID=A0A1H3VMJ6_9BACT|nr:DUF6624 domain-containing protein [Arachidicoccus rhizosphaerae]SDZ75312.1 hypothetical protein SAMN05192529_101235 [Arachidicoccus rhizosphaerae]
MKKNVGTRSVSYPYRRFILLFSLPVLFISGSRGAWAQPASDTLLAKGKTYFAAASFDTAFVVFSQLLEDTAGVNPDLYYYGITSAVQTAHMDQAFIWLGDYIQAVQAPQVSFYQLQYNLEAMYTDPRWPAYLLQMRQKLSGYDQDKGYDLALKDSLDEIFYLDQRDRILIAPYEKKYGDTSTQMQQVWERIGRQDSINLALLQHLWNRHGWLSKSRVGSAAVTQWVVIQHADLAVQKKYLPLLKQAAAKGDIKKSSLALTIDRILSEEGKEQLYGSQLSRIKWQGSYRYVIDPIADPEHLDQRRKEMGMKPMADYARDFDIDWSLKNYKADLEKLKRSSRP